MTDTRAAASDSDATSHRLPILSSAAVNDVLHVGRSVTALPPEPGNGAFRHPRALRRVAPRGSRRRRWSAHGSASGRRYRRSVRSCCAPRVPASAASPSVDRDGATCASADGSSPMLAIAARRRTSSALPTSHRGSRSASRRLRAVLRVAPDELEPRLLRRAGAARRHRRPAWCGTRCPRSRTDAPCARARCARAHRLPTVAPEIVVSELAPRADHLDSFGRIAVDEKLVSHGGSPGMRAVQDGQGSEPPPGAVGGGCADSCSTGRRIAWPPPRSFRNSSAVRRGP